ncbi:DUF2569 domain-containing protein [Providencia rettgeri]
MKCIRCNLGEGNKGSGFCDDCEMKEMKQINGILYLPALGLISNIVLSVYNLYSILDVVINHFQLTSFISYYAMGAILTTIIWIIVTLSASWFFFLRKKRIRLFMSIYYVINLVCAIYFTMIPYIVFDSVMTSFGIQNLLSGIVGVFIWIPYFFTSKRINVVFCK